jgi:H+/Cl- antiporter ClcA
MEDALNTIISLLPEHQHQNVLAWLYVASGCLAVVRWGLSRWAPKAASSKAVQVVDALAHYATLSSKKLGDRKDRP